MRRSVDMCHHAPPNVDVYTGPVQCEHLCELSDFTSVVVRGLMLAADAAVAHPHPVTVSGPSLVSHPRSHRHPHRS